MSEMKKVFKMLENHISSLFPYSVIFLHLLLPANIH